MQIDLRIMELLTSKICHDLVSPVSAINNGVELIEDIGGSVVDEAMKLIGDSAGQAARRLRLFRMAYGRAGSEEILSIHDVKVVAEQYLSTSKVTLNWLAGQPSAELAGRRGYLKTILNLVILSEEILAYGGVVSLRAVSEGDLEGCRVEIIGRNAQLTPAMQDAIDASVASSELTPRSIQAYMCGMFARNFDLTLNFDQSVPDRLDIKLFAKPVIAALAEMPSEVALDVLPSDSF